MLLLVFGHRDDDTVGLRQDAEPGRDGLASARQGPLGLREDLGAGGEVERGVGAESLLDRRQVRRPEHPFAECRQLRIDPRDLIEADRVDLLCSHRQRGMGLDQSGVGLGATRDVDEPGLIVRARGRPDLVADDRDVAFERRPDAVTDRPTQALLEGRSFRGRPVRMP